MFTKNWHQFKDEGGRWVGERPNGELVDLGDPINKWVCNNCESTHNVWTHPEQLGCPSCGYGCEELTCACR